MVYYGCAREVFSKKVVRVQGRHDTRGRIYFSNEWGNDIENVLIYISELSVMFYSLLVVSSFEVFRQVRSILACTGSGDHCYLRSTVAL